MNFFIEPQTVAATRCEKDYECLYGTPRKLCQPEFKYSDRLYLNCRHDEGCLFNGLPKGFVQCDCPVRKEIFRNYGV
jgi:hypothetical protein